MGSVAHLSQQVLNDREKLCPTLYKSPREKLSILVAVALEAGSCNTMDWAARLPIETARAKSRYAWIERFLSAPTLPVEATMRPLAAQILSLACAGDQTAAIALDRTSLEDRHGIAMVSLRVGNRGLPLFCKTKAAAGNLPTSDYLALLEEAVSALPKGAKALLMADRFFNASTLIDWCRTRGWGWRIRLRSNLYVSHEGGERHLGEMPSLKLSALEGATLSGGAITHIGYLHEPGHEEPWFIAMDTTPTRTAVLDYGLRGGIEAMFSDYKSRGFGLEETQLQRPDRLCKLLLVLAVAMHWAVISGLQLQKKHRRKVALNNSLVLPSLPSSEAFDFSYTVHRPSLHPFL